MHLETRIGICMVPAGVDSILRGVVGEETVAFHPRRSSG